MTCHFLHKCLSLKEARDALGYRRPLASSICHSDNQSVNLGCLLCVLLTATQICPSSHVVHGCFEGGEDVQQHVMEILPPVSRSPKLAQGEVEQKEKEDVYRHPEQEDK